MSERLHGRVAVTPRSLSGGHPALERLVDAGLEVVFPSPGRTPSTADLLAHLPECVAYLAGVEPVTAEVISAAPALRVIARNGVGIDNVDVEAARVAGVAVRTAVGANARGVAELTVGLLLATARHLPAADAAMKDRQWERRLGRELAGCTLGLLGLGSIGRTVAELATGLGLRVLGHDPWPPSDWAPSGFVWASAAEVVESADFLSLHVPATSTPLVDAELLHRMRPGSVLINTARSELVDDRAVLGALDEGRLSAYAVDAFVTEPPTDWELVTHPRVVATPHIGGFTQESVERAAEGAVDAILDELHSLVRG